MPGMSKSSAVFFGVIFFDQLTKYLARRQIVISAAIIENPGLPFFGIDLPGFFDLILVLVLLVIFVVSYLRNWHSPSSQIGFSMVAAGAASNIFDRLTKGGVTDFINLGTGNTFNFADIAIIIGIPLLALQASRNPKS